MNKDTSNMRYVAFFDMLGFKEAVRRDIDEAWGALEDLRVSMEDSLNLFVKTPNQIIIKSNNDRIIATNFSVCGPPLIKAYELGQSAQWSGIIVDNEVAERYYKNPIKSSAKLVIEQRIVPVKNECETKKEKMWVFNWPLVCRENFTVKAPISPQLYSAAFESLFKSSYEDWPEYIQAIYNNTVEFINSVLGQEDL